MPRRAEDVLRRGAERPSHSHPVRGSERCSSTSGATSPSAASRGCSVFVSSRVRPQSPPYIAYTSANGTQHRRPLSLERESRCPFEPEDPARAARTRMAITTEAPRVRQGRDAVHDGWDGGSGGDRRTGRRTCSRSSASCSARRLEGRSGVGDRGLGLRNAWRFSFDRATGDLYLGDVGQGSVEEVDFTPRESPGLENYGGTCEGSERFEGGEPRAGELVFPIRVRAGRGQLHGDRGSRLPCPRRGRRSAGGTSSATTAAGSSGA